MTTVKKVIDKLVERDFGQVDAGDARFDFDSEEERRNFREDVRRNFIERIIEFLKPSYFESNFGADLPDLEELWAEALGTAFVKVGIDFDDISEQEETKLYNLVDELRPGILTELQNHLRTLIGEE